jgi:carboxylate-amine ligase
MEFTKSAALTFGLELEFQIVNSKTGLLSPSSLEIWEKLADHEDSARFSLEATLSTMEINSSVHTQAHAMYTEIQTLTDHIQTVADEMGLNIRGGGTQMAQFWNDRVMAPTERARELEKKFGFLPKRFSTYGMHVHIGMANGNDAIPLPTIYRDVSRVSLFAAGRYRFRRCTSIGNTDLPQWWADAGAARLGTL